MNKNVLLVLAAVVIVGLGLFMFMGGDKESTEDKSNNQTSEQNTEPVAQNESEPADPNQADVVVTYTDEGFDPADQTITVGDSVEFVNNSSKSMWVASDNHPTHTELPEFDNKQGIGQGESYTFTFEEAGEWGYHNHLNDSDEGTITVVAE